MEEMVVMVTVGSEGEATSLSRILVKNGLAACVNIIPGVRSIFHWEGEIAEEQEFLLLAKTVRRSYDQLVSLVKANHSYEVPEIIALPIQLGSEEYLAWIRDATKSRVGMNEE
ncbi:divalent-cation tolerance protein CutA [Candidatus Nitrospira allomarina]|jgi:periplasmic divalent cation tolerance protein|uniref:Divalent-cation tolerance protein CutA n=1 Tax=Candidatus Nitrospira allomarina TaxID=3020900 RepID=A0AA96GGU7_9BACT|nr:divalent-cation tolerance protein CutA [Candidatus Nitrospira allomarina]WNM58683.1 divalent-cation tolerance protein CutA [Candidatus Nitrospira allomarina]